METNPQLIGKRLNLIDQTFKGLASVLRNSLSEKGLPPVPIITPQSSAEQREQYRVEGKVEYPNIVINISGIAKNRSDTYNDALRRSGINVPRDNNTYSNLSLVPITLSLSLKYSSQSFHEVVHFCELWLRAEMDSQFYLSSGNLNLYVKCVFGEDISFPQQQFTENGQFFYCETTLTVATYSGNIYTRTKINKLSVSAEIQPIDGTNIVIESLNPKIKAT